MSNQASPRLSGLDERQRRRLAEALRARSQRPAGPLADYDLAVLGGGVAGLTLALQVARTRPDTRVVVIEKQTFPVVETTHKVGESTVEIAAHYLRDVLGLGDHLEAAHVRKFGLRMFFSHGDNGDIAERVEVGSSVFPPLTTYQLDRGRLENELADRCRRQGIRLLTGTRVLEVDSEPQADRHPQHPHRVRVTGAEGPAELTATWLVDASGRSQQLRRGRGLTRLGNNHHANAAWLRIAHPIDIAHWTRDPDWSARICEGDRSLSTNHLMGPGYWVWLIRLAGGSTSVGIVADPAVHPFPEFNTLDRALGWLATHEPQLAETLSSRRSQVRDFRVMSDYSYNCEQVYDGAQRWCLTGESGLFLDPLYSPGLDLIAISNGLVSDLVVRGLDGEDVRARAQVHDRLFRTIADIWLGVYRQQYTLLSNARVMASKVIWDTAFYWGVFATLFFNDRFRDLSELPSVAGDLARLTAVSNRMQAFFRQWHDIDGEELAPRFVDLYAPLDFMVSLHHGIADDLDVPAFCARFSDNTRLLSQLAGQLVSAVIEHHAGAFDDPVVRRLQAWQRDPLLAELIAVHRRERRTRPTSDGWIFLGSDPVNGLGPAACADPARDAVPAQRSAAARTPEPAPLPAPGRTTAPTRSNEWDTHGSLAAPVPAA